jgi:glucose/arabinose dehydrogenase/mono/diheme cytochrome c family protein
MPKLFVFLSYLFVASFLIRCNEKDNLPKGDSDNGGLFLPDGFEALVVTDSIGSARHLAVNKNGDIYVKLRDAAPKSGNVGIRVGKDGKADSITYFGDYPVKGGYGPTGMRIHNDYLYFSTGGAVYRNKLTPGKLIPESKIETILVDDYEHDIHGHEHIGKPLAFDNEGHMYVPYGAPSDVCQVTNRTPGLPGQDPCPELSEHGGIWQFDANKLNQTQKDGKRYATGIRSVIAMDWNHADNTLYALQHGRDAFNRAWPELYTAWETAVLPSEEFFRVKEGMDGGWPYYYYDQNKGKKLLNPEYGGDGEKEGKGAEYTQPIIGFPGHFAPNDLLFYTGNQFPEHYKNGAFIAFHGSTIRAPYPQAGYFVCFVPFKNGAPSGPWEVFADGFAEKDTIVNPGDAAHRPMGLAMGPDGSLYISDAVKGKIRRVMFKGNKDAFGSDQLAKMEKRKTRTNIKTPDAIKDNLDMKLASAGEKAYKTYCSTCHQGDGKGDGDRFPSLNGSEWVVGDKSRLINVVLNGLEGPITVKGKSFNGTMPKHDFLSDADIAQILTYIRLNFDNNSSAIREKEVARFRNKPTAQSVSKSKK